MPPPPPPPLKSLTLILSPYHNGLRNLGPGAGPPRLLSHNLLAALRSTGVPLLSIVDDLDPSSPSTPLDGDIPRIFELFRRTSLAVSRARAAGSFPIVVSGDCGASVGVAAGLLQSGCVTDKELGCVWFDAHDDLNTPDTLASGYFDSMPIAMLAGLCWKGLLATIPGFRPLSLDGLVHCGLRDVTALERQRVEEAGYDVVWGDAGRKVDFVGELGTALDGERHRGQPKLVHLDLDCLDVSLGKVNQFSAPGGLFEDDLLGCLEAIAAKTQPLSLTVAAFDPRFEGADRIADVAVQAIKGFVMALVKNGVLLAQEE
ncbi:arginase [Phialemonium atrogriseum]|uniref:Arginase n=1 Tax=Phialemonium atrogriseum TaxID=1093897 RepID=A0AAJ0BSE5_9PEZI|nr:arginase [Phialemonium atrogriseum]KAK1762172.1 arginase [Phialemonium atrogriseum]